MVIAWAGIRTMAAKRAFLGLMMGAWIPFLVQAVRLYIASNVPQARAFLSVSPQMFRDFLTTQSWFVFFVTIYVGAGLIANDRRANALQIYLSKPLMRTEYIGGKLAVLAFFLVEVTLVPALLLLMLQVMFSGSFTFLRANLFLLPSIVLGSLLQVVVSSFTMLALSSLSKSSRFVGLLFTGAIMFSNAMFGVLVGITGSTRMAWVSFTLNISQVTDVVFRQTPRFETPWGVSLLVLIGLVAVSVSVLERRVRGVEIVS
jgi:ABC-type transport system involved in multi-copper enzyme maturation permease subunit